MNTCRNVLTNVLTPCHDSYMNSNQLLEVRFTAKRACIWRNQRWITISRDKAQALIATGQAVELKQGEWI